MMFIQHIYDYVALGVLLDFLTS